MSGATKAPALSSTPSMPSASAASAHTFCCPISAAAKPRQNSPARPPRPLGAPGARGRIVTVVSPPDRITQGLAKDAPRGATARQRPVHLADLARLAFHLVGEDVGLDAGGARRRCSGFERLLRRGDHVRGVATEHAVAG